ncbi:TetR/AcrR family transcriptional regulator [Alsobacter sp. SYSU M60028]|uniref:TetR/AcrR family transcriptional regulator n=2 Tax=Alsobacter ponti TaxID=2962936 RepID=A0ABT1LG82_9HYPH|nr:TetR/AcrR family transcriptional regulator [Alsobacter ponti]
MSALERREDIVAQAVRFFAAEGFAGTTHDLAARMGVRQALIYRYFPSKEALIEAAFRRVTDSRWTRDLAGLMADRSAPLEQRLADVYCAYAAQDDGAGIRLLLRAALDRMTLPPPRGATLTTQILDPLLAELRHGLGLPDPARLPPLTEERELLMTLHGAMVQQAVREHVYGQPPPLGREAAIRLAVAAFLPGAREAIARLHGRRAAPPSGRAALDRLARRV